MRVLGLIPARGGSKGIPRKNALPVAGKPLVAWTIEAARSARLDRVVVSTDDDEIAALAREHGAEVLERPAELAADATPALPVIRHALEHDLGREADAVAYLQPTSPLRRPGHIDAALDLLAPGVDSVVSVVAVPHCFNPVSVLRLGEDGALAPFLPDQPLLLRRQDKPVVYARNGPAVLVVRRETVLEAGVLYGPRTLPLVMSRHDSHDIDEPFDLELVEWLLRRRSE